MKEALSRWVPRAVIVLGLVGMWKLNRYGIEESRRSAALATPRPPGKVPRDGVPLELRFTALDGREVDLAALRGKVVLMDFWSTTCGQCVADLPRVRNVFEQFHPQGLEVIGISLDNERDRERLKECVAQQKLPWPQHFDGEGWSSPLAKRFGIYHIPAMMLLDKKGAFREFAHKNLAADVKRLLAEP